MQLWGALFGILSAYRKRTSDSEQEEKSTLGTWRSRLFKMEVSGVAVRHSRSCREVVSEVRCRELEAPRTGFVPSGPLWTRAVQKRHFLGAHDGYVQGILGCCIGGNPLWQWITSDVA
jgi:hypothetical protein